MFASTRGGGHATHAGCATDSLDSRDREASCLAAIEDAAHAGMPRQSKTPDWGFEGE